MSTSDLITELTVLGVQLLPRGCGIRVEPLLGAVPEALQAALVVARSDLVAWLAEEQERWDEIQAHQIVSMTLADIAATYPRGCGAFDAASFRAFDAALLQAIEARSIQAIRAACMAYRQCVKSRISAAAEPAKQPA